MRWEKINKIYDPQYAGGGYTYGSNPVAVRLEGNIYRIYFNVRDKNNKSYITYLDYDIRQHKSIDMALSPIIYPGSRGYYDDSGCSLGSIVRIAEDMEYIYYLGWNLRVTVPWGNSLGLVKHNLKEDTYTKYSEAPIMDRNEVDPLSISYPYVMKRANKFYMWYGSNLDWGNSEHSMNYVIKYATSDDGIQWNRSGAICIQGHEPSEYAFARPSVITENGIFKMWYTYRGEKYRIGYAESQDGIKWMRKDNEAGIEPSEQGFDSEEVCYPMVFRHDGDLYMLYCGNGYGKTGFGIAMLAE